MGLAGIFLFIGAVLLVLETVLPGMIAGIVGAGFMFVGIVLSYQHLGLMNGTWLLLGVLLLVAGGFTAYLKHLPNSRVGKALISQSIGGGLGGEPLDLLGQQGVAHTDLRPAGTALIGSRRVDVVADGSFLPKGAAVKVVGVEGMKVVVQAVV